MACNSDFSVSECGDMIVNLAAGDTCEMAAKVAMRVAPRRGGGGGAGDAIQLGSPLTDALLGTLNSAGAPGGGVAVPFTTPQTNMGGNGGDGQIAQM